MSYELRQEEPFAIGVKRIVVEQVDIAARVLAQPTANGGVDEAVHEARRCFKRVRSAFRLARPVVRSHAYRRENTYFRRLGMALASPRESAVALLTIDGLTEHFATLLRPGAFSELRAHFVERHTLALWRVIERDEAPLRVLRRLRKARRRIASLPVREVADLSWTPGVRRAYRSGINWMTEAYLGRSPGAFHEWRKQAKHFRYHLRILRGSWDGQLDQAADLLHQLTDILGIHHDLTDLRLQLEWNPATSATKKRRMENHLLRALIDGRRADLETDARELGQRLYSRKPKVVVGRLISCWDQWQGAAD